MTLVDRVRATFAPGGPLARRLAGWEPRPQQEDLAVAIAESLKAGEHMVGEAGTGVGKSFAYLLPAILWADATGQRIVISTRTKALQAQLAEKDLPFLQGVLPIEFTWSVAVGRNNYACLRRMHKALANAHTLFPEPDRVAELERIRDWAHASPERGVRDELPFVPAGSVWDEVQAEQGNCLGVECPHYAPCHWQRGRQRMQHARVLVVNHSLYFADVALRAAGVRYLPEHECVVFDEAHHLENVASEALGVRLSPGMIEWQLSRLAGRDGRRGLLRKLKLHDAVLLVDHVRHRAAQWFGVVDTQLGHNCELRLHADAPFDASLAEGLSHLAHRLVDAADRFDHEQAMELRSRAERLGNAAAAVRMFARPQADNEVRWLERERKQVVARLAPLDVGELLKEQLFARVPRCVLVSATLGPPANGFGWMRQRLGLAEARTLCVDSPFPYGDNVKLEIAEGLPDPGRDSEAWEREATERITELCIANGGRALILCTSHGFVQACRAHLATPCAEHGLRLLVQGDGPLPQLIAAKRDDPASVLVGTDALWEGIDIAGDAVTLVVLTRVPFPVPTHPLVEARAEAIARSGQSSFYGYSLPLAMLKLRQGFGRLVRSTTDRGRVVLLDPRIVRRSYGRHLVAALPACGNEDGYPHGGEMSG